MATEETAGGARKATKSKLFEFLVHGVVSGAVRHSSCEASGAPACVRARARVRARGGLRAGSLGRVKVISSSPDLRLAGGGGLRSGAPWMDGWMDELQKGISFWLTGLREGGRGVRTGRGGGLLPAAGWWWMNLNL